VDGCRSLRQCASVTTVMMQSHVRQWHQYADATVTAADLIVTRTNAVKASSAQWALVERLRTLMPNARVTLRVHKLTWKRDTRLPALIRNTDICVTFRDAWLSFGSGSQPCAVRMRFGSCFCELRHQSACP